MGLSLSKLYDFLMSWSETVPSRILLLGLDGAGKYILNLKEIKYFLDCSNLI